MRLLMIGVPLAAEQVKGYSDVWLFQLSAAFRAHGVELVFHPRYRDQESPGEYAASVLDMARREHVAAILAPGVRYFTMIPREIGEILKSEFAGWVAHVYDGSMLDSAPVDITFTVRDDTWRYEDNPSRMRRHKLFNKYVGWAADSELFYRVPKTSQAIQIFIDHAAFDTSGFDYSLTVMMNLAAIGVPFTARTLTDDGIVTIDPDNISVKPYQRNAVPVAEFAEALRGSDVFIVTHPESLGLTVLEAAMCGALILAPQGALPPDRIKLVNHLIYSSRINWPEVIGKIDHAANAARVVDCTWKNVARRMLVAFEQSKA